MKVLADTNLFVFFCRRLPMPKQVETVLEDPKTLRCVSAISVLEIYRLWQNGQIPDNPDTWIEQALPAWQVMDVNWPIARQSVLWPWPHKDPADRIIAATAQVNRVELWHTDTVLKKLTGFPHQYFTNVEASKDGAGQHAAGQPVITDKPTQG